MVLNVIMNKIKSLLFILVNIFKRALCCFRRKRRQSFDAVPLTHVGVVPANDDNQNWDWNDKFEINQPKTVQDHIDIYRKQIQQTKPEDLPQEEQLDFFGDMTPNITRQTKLLVGSTNTDNYTSNRFNVLDTNAPALETGELREWEETTGWEGETLDWDAQAALREKKRQEREKRLWEQQQKRQERLNRTLGARVSS